VAKTINMSNIQRVNNEKVVATVIGIHSDEDKSEKNNYLKVHAGDETLSAGSGETKEIVGEFVRKSHSSPSKSFRHFCDNDREGVS
jgi:hypothetical protein